MNRKKDKIYDILNIYMHTYTWNKEEKGEIEMRKYKAKWTMYI